MNRFLYHEDDPEEDENGPAFISVAISALAGIVLVMLLTPLQFGSDFMSIMSSYSSEYSDSDESNEETLPADQVHIITKPDDQNLDDYDLINKIPDTDYLVISKRRGNAIAIIKGRIFIGENQFTERMNNLLIRLFGESNSSHFGVSIFVPQDYMVGQSIRDEIQQVAVIRQHLDSLGVSIEEIRIRLVPVKDSQDRILIIFQPNTMSDGLILNFSQTNNKVVHHV